MKHAPYDPTEELGGGMRALEASAGTGKTFAITSNVLRLVVERTAPFEMDRLLLVTFTRAATAELEDRVRRRLVEGQRALTRAAGDDGWTTDDAVLRAVVEHAREHGLDEARRRVEEALRTVDQATVTTIHGFCHQVLRAAAVHTDADPAVQIDTDDDRLVRAVVDDWMVRFTHDADEDLVELLHDLKLDRGHLHTIGRVVAGEPDPRLVPDPPAEDLDPFAEIAAARARLRAALDDPEDTLAAARQAKEDGDINGRSTWAPQKLPGRIATLRDALDDGTAGRDEVKYLDPLGVDGDGRRAMPVGIAATSIPRAVAGLTETRARIETWIRRRLADDVRTELRRRRDEAGTASFADLLRQLAAALDADDEGAIARDVGSQFDAVLVDEFQDTDPVQWSILRRLFAQCEVFQVVGDPKQAIYGWRGADLATYLHALEEAGDRTRTMQTNWRSDRRLVEALNHLLGPEDSLGGTVEYHEVNHAPGRDARLQDEQGEDAAGLQLTHVVGLGSAKVAAVRKRIAEEVAQDVVETLGSGLTIPAEDDDPRDRRRVVAADCAVLVRRHTEAAAVAAELRARDVPVVVGGGDDVLLSAEADAMADLLRVLVAPGDDRALRRLLVGPFVGLGADDLAELSDEQWQDHAVDVRRWAATWADHGVAAAVQRAIREGEAEARHARTRSGDRTMTNLRHLTELLHRAEQEEALGTHALAAWFDARRAEAADEQTPPERELRLERDDAAVQVLTVHAAKGLEFPLVWVPFLWTREGRGTDQGDPFVVNDPAADHARTVALHAGSSKAVRQLDEDRRRLREAYEVAEWEGGLRLAYVALTRAEHRCTIHLCAYDHQGSLPASPAWQLFWRDLGSGRPGPGFAAPADIDEDRLRQQLRELGDHPAIDVVERREVRTPTSYAGDPEQAPLALAARQWGRDTALDVHWGRASFTGLLRGRVAPPRDDADAADEVDTDQTVAVTGHGLPPLPVERCADEPAVPLEALPRGAGWGTFLHDVLEHAEFGADVEDLGALVADRARWAPVRVGEDDLDVATRGLHAALATPLGPALAELQLRDVTRRNRLDELDFSLALGDDPAASFDVGDIAGVLDQHADTSDAPLAAAADHLRRGGTGRPVHGLLIGSIDLVLRHDDRFWIADYKSNGLGQWLEPTGDEEQGRWCETEAHTGPERVMAAMLQGDYLLQAHLYVVALHRYLRARLGDAYDYDTHVGGWAYLFLRGMTGEQVRRTDGQPHGIATGRPTRALVEDLDRVLRGAARA